MPHKITGTPEFVKKIKQVFDHEKETSRKIYFKENTASWIEISCALNHVDSLMESLRTLEIKGVTLSGKTTRGQVWFLAQEALLIEAFGNDVETTINKQKVVLDKKLYEYEEELSEEGFIRIGKSVLINTKKIESVASAYNGKLLLYLNNDEKVYVNRSYSKHFKEVLTKKRG